MKCAILGAGGRMGRLVVDEIIAREDCELAGGTVRPGSDDEGRDLGELAGGSPLGVRATSDPAELFARANVVVDFSRAELAPRHAALAAEHGVALVIGTTGFDDTAVDAIHQSAETVPIMLAANTSLGITLLLDLVEQVAASLGNEFDIEISEMHHRHKVDAPSGAALSLGEAAARGRGIRLRDAAERGRDGATGPRAEGAIGFASLRGGDVVGEHTVTFAGKGERIELTHRCTDRSIFAVGAVRAALWMNETTRAGLYDMRDVLTAGRNGS